MAADHPSNDKNHSVMSKSSSWHIVYKKSHSWNHKLTQQTHLHTSCVHTWHTTLTLQHPPHVSAQCSHPWVAVHGYHHVAHCHQSLLGAYTLQACMEDLILLDSTRRTDDFHSITICNDTSMMKMIYKGSGIHFCNEPVPEVVKDLFSCTERGDVTHILPTSTVHCRATLHPLRAGSLARHKAKVKCTLPSLSF